MNMHCFPSLLWLRVANFEQELAKYYEITELFLLGLQIVTLMIAF